MQPPSPLPHVMSAQLSSPASGPKGLLADTVSRLASDQSCIRLLDLEELTVVEPTGLGRQILVVRLAGGGSDWIVEQSNDVTNATFDRLATEHAYHLEGRSAGRPLLDEMRHRLQNRVVASGLTELTLLRSGLRTATVWEARRPHASLLVATRGPHAERAIMSLGGSHLADFEADLDRLLLHHERAMRVATEWERAGAVAAITAAAVSVMEALGIRLSDVLEILAHHARAGFASTDGLISGSFRWDEFRIVVEMHDRTGYRVVGETLTVTQGRWMETVIAAASGKRLGEVIETTLLHADRIISRISNCKAGLRVDLEPIQLMIDHRLNVIGNLQRWPPEAATFHPQ